MNVRGDQIFMHLQNVIGTGLILILAAALLSGCGLIYTNVQVPRAYRSASPIDVEAKASDKIVTGKGCNQSVLFLVAWGNGGYVAAVRDALKDEPYGSILYDVKTDLKAKAYLVGLYTKTCTVVTGKVASP
jgi:TRL-like protein family